MIAAILRKEIRENLLWAAAGLGAVSLAFFAGLSQGSGLLPWLGRSYHYGVEIPLLSERLLSYTTAVYAIFGAALGLLQTIPESIRGTYAFVVPRPVRRGTIFLCKAAGGAAIFLVAGGLPLAAALVWVATPGHYAAPFRIGMAGAVSADFLCGFVFYCAGLLTGVRRARWYGTRLAGLVVALVVLTYAHAVSGFLTAVAIELGGAALLFWAAYAAFVRKEF